MAEVIKVSIGAALSTGFSSIFASAEKNVEGLGASVKDLKSKVGDVGAHRRLQEETLALGEAHDKSRAQLALARKEMEASKKPTREQIKLVKDAEKEELRLSKALEIKSDALEQSSQKLRAAGVNTKNLADEERRLTEELARQERYTKAKSNLREHLGITGDSGIKSIGEHFGNLRQSATSAFRDVMIVGGAAGAGLFALAKTTADYGDEVAETAQYIGISTQALQEFRGVGMRVGLEVSEMDKALEKFSINLGKAANNGSKGREEFRKMGLNLDQLIKMGPEKAMEKVAQAIARMPKHTKQAAAAVEIFGKSGLKMLNVLGGGSKELARMREEVRKTGMVMGPEQLEVAGKFDDAWSGIKQTMLGVRNTVGIALIPALSDMFGKLTTYVQGHGPEIKQFASDLAVGFQQFAEKIPGIVSDLSNLFGMVWKVADATQELLGGWDNLALAMVAVRFLPVALDAIKLTKSVWDTAMSIKGVISAAGGLMPLITATFPALTGAVLTLGAAIMATPIGWVIGGIALIGVALFALYKNFDVGWAWIKGFIQGIMSEGIQPLLDALAPLGEALGTIMDMFSDLFAPVNATKQELEGATAAGIRFGQLVGHALNLTLMPIRLILDGLQKIGRALGLIDNRIDFSTDEGVEKSLAEIDARVGGKGVPSAVPAGGGSRSFSSNNTYNFKVDGSKDPNESAKIIREEIERMDREKAASARSSFSDGGGF